MMEDNVVILPVVTRLDVPVERIINAAMEADLESIVIVGYDKDGEQYFASSIADGGTILWLFEKAKKDLLAIGEL
jgi:hypothetical protein